MSKMAGPVVNKVRCNESVSTKQIFEHIKTKFTTTSERRSLNE